MKINTKRLNPEVKGDITLAADILNKGGIVALPTETVYGLAASAFNSEAVKKVFIAKGRPQDNPLIVHISDTKMLSMVTKDVPEVAFDLAKEFWPGPLTMVLPKSDKICQEVSCGLDTVGIRCPDNACAKAVIESGGLPLAAPSANASGSPSPTSADHVLNDLDGKIDAVFMGDTCEVGVESTVITLCTTPPCVLRPGAVTLEQLREFLPDIVVDKAVLEGAKKGEKVASPGMKYRHYAPKAKLVLVEGDSAAFCEYANKNATAAVCFSEDKEQLTVKSVVYGSNKKQETLAHSLFSVLRELDEMGIESAVVHAPTKDGVGLAVYNRLIRACEYNVVSLGENQ